MEKPKRIAVRAMELLLFTENGKFKGARLQPIKHKHIPLDSADMQALAHTFRIMAETFETGVHIHADFEKLHGVNASHDTKLVFTHYSQKKKAKKVGS